MPKVLRDINILLPVLTGRTHVTPFCQLTCSVSKPGLVGKPIQLALFEVGAIPTGNGAVSVAASRSRKPRKRGISTFTQLCLDLN